MCIVCSINKYKSKNYIWYNLATIYFFFISFYDVYDTSNLNLMDLTMNRYDHIVGLFDILNITSNLLNSISIAFFCALIVYLTCYYSELFYKIFKFIFSLKFLKSLSIFEIRETSTRKSERFYEYMEEAACAAFVYLLAKTVYFYIYLTYILHINLNSIPKLLFESIFYFSIFICVIFINIVLNKIERDEDAIKVILKDHSKDFILTVLDRGLELTFISFLLISGSLVASIITNGNDFKITFQFVIFFVLVLLAFVQLISFRVLSIGVLLDRQIKIKERRGRKIRQ